MVDISEVLSAVPNPNSARKHASQRRTPVDTRHLRHVKTADANQADFEEGKVREE